MSEQRGPNLWLPPSPDPYAPSADDFRAPPEPQRSPEPDPARAGDAFGGEPKPWWKRAGGGIAALGLLIAKFAAKIKVVLLLLPKLKILTTSGTMLVSVAAYSLIWGWKFALGFVALLFVHEMGHVIQLRREGVEASAPVFIPFLGAAVWAKSLGGNALAEARVGLAGPVLGSLGAAACIPIANATGNDFWKALAFTGLLPEPLQPAAGRPARRRPRDGRDGAVDVVRRAARDPRARVHLPEPDHPPDRAAGRDGDVAALALAALGRRGACAPTTGCRGCTARSSPASTSA